MTKRYDLIALGTGTDASNAASRCRAAGAAIDLPHRIRGNGIPPGGPAIACNELIELKRTFTESMPR